MRINTNNSSQKGFTIVELLIATTVFSVILLLVTYGILQIGKSYYKGLNISKTQNVTRSLIDSVSQDVQLSSDSPQSTPDTVDPNIVSICAGGNRYIANLGYRLVSDGSIGDFGVLFEKNPSSSSCDTITLTPPSANAKELLSTGMRLVKFDIITPGSGSLYGVDVRVVFGDKDLVCSPSLESAVCSDGGVDSTHLDATDLTCKNEPSGNQYCAVSELNTTIQKRL